MSINEKSKAIFSENYIGCIATVNQDGSPWASPVHMFTDDEYVYWFSKPEKQHSENIVRDARVHLTLFSSDTSRGLQGVYIAGRAEVYAEAGSDEQRRIYQQMVKRVGEDKMPPNMDKSHAYRLPIGTVDEQKSTGNCWYFYS
jgi:general stress protein 26